MLFNYRDFQRKSAALTEEVLESRGWVGIEVKMAKLTRLLRDNCGRACYVLPVLSTPLSFMSDFSPRSSMPHLQQQANQGHVGVLSLYDRLQLDTDSSPFSSWKATLPGGELVLSTVKLQSRTRTSASYSLSGGVGIHSLD